MVGLLGCKKNNIEIDIGYDYVPIETGMTHVYQVRDIFHDEALVPANDTNYYQIKTVIGDFLINDANDTVYEFRRFFRTDDSQPWIIQDLWTIENTDNRILLVEENRKLIDFVFPPSLNQIWDANAFNNLEAKTSRFTRVNATFNMNDFSFDSACVVSHQNFSSFVDYNQEYDVFAKGVGKVYSQLKELTIDNFDTLDIKKGIEIEYKLISYSK